MPRLLIFGFICLSCAFCGSAAACTNFIATKGATVDGSVMVTYTCDGEFHPHLRHLPAVDHEPGAMEELVHWSGEILGEIPYPARTYQVVNLMNEHQVTIAETTTGGREELTNPDGMLDYWTLMRLVLQRSATAREAVEVMGDLVAEYGYRSSGESFYIGDPDEAWVVEMVGPGPGGKGAHWVALRVPDGYVIAHANLGRIDTFDRKDKDNVLASKGMEKFAADQGWYDPDTDGDFSWRQVFHPTTPQNLRYTATRVWSLYRRCAPSQAWPADFHRGVEGAEPLPLWIKPEKKLSRGRRFRTDARSLRRHRIRHDPRRRCRPLRHPQPLAAHGLGNRRRSTTPGNVPSPPSRPVFP